MADNHAFRLIAITPEIPVADEGLKIESLLINGWDKVHLRHPGKSRDGILEIINSVSRQLHPRIILHDHFDIAGDLAIGGLHLNRRNPSPPPGYSGNLSKSCHSVCEAYNASGMEYVTLSPIFDSNSKAGYRAPFSEEDLESLDAVTTPVIALGGVTAESLPTLKKYNFAGAAMLGAAGWHLELSDFTEYIRNIIESC